MSTLIRILSVALLVALTPLSLRAAAARTITVRTSDELRRSVADAGPGTRILLAPGKYEGGLYRADLNGTADLPIVIAAADPADRPIIEGTGTGFHFAGPAYVELRDLILIGARQNGLNIDDGGSFGTPARHIRLHGLTIRDVGDRGNQDGIKLSGVVDFQIENCTIENWGTGGGSAIDMVGCHRGLIESNLFRHTDTTGSTGVQNKGGTSEIVVRQNRFENAGGRAVNLGGSTGLQFFRPPLLEGTPHCEAKDILVEGNTFIGSGAPVAFVGVDGAVVRFNTIYHPKRWALRILQENRAPGFVPSRNGEFSHNLIVFRSSEWGEGGVNIGPGTAPETFKFSHNWWYCEDAPERSRPRLPADEEAGEYGRDPLLRAPSNGDVRLSVGSPAEAVGADASMRKEN